MTKEEIMKMTSAEIEARLAEIKDLMSSEDADFEALSAEIDFIKERKAAIADEQRKADIQAVLAGDDTVDTTIKAQEGRKMPDIKEIRSSQEYMDAYANALKAAYRSESGYCDFTECRALLTDLGGGTIPTPVFVEEIISTAWERDTITRRVKRSYMKGTVRIGVEIGGDEAAVHTEGSAAPSAENLVIAVVSITPETIKKWIQVSDEVLDSTSEAFLRYIYDELTYRVAKKAAARLLAKIQAAGTVSTNTSTTNIAVAAISTNAIDVGLVAEAMGELTDEAADPVIIMNKKTWSAFKRVQYANGYNVDPFEGLPVLFNNSIKSFAAATTGEAFLIVGDLGAGAQMNFPVGDEVKIKYDDMDDAEADLVKIVSRLPVGSAVIKEFAFCQVKKA